MRYLVDGYNVIFSNAAAPTSPQEGRQWLIRRLIPVSDRHEVVVVFDAPAQPHFSRHHLGKLEIVFTANGESADAYIAILLEQRERASETMVVTSDRRLQRRCRELGAGFMVPATFWKKAKGKIICAETKPESVPQVEIERWFKIFRVRLESEGGEGKKL
jgi:predicted RNA-binding protein with PIN domain